MRLANVEARPKTVSHNERNLNMVTDVKDKSMGEAAQGGVAALRHRNLGGALANYFSVPYEPFRFGRRYPPVIGGNLIRERLEAEQWLPIAVEQNLVTVMCIDPQKIRSQHLVESVFPKCNIQYCVTTPEEFSDSLTQAYGTVAHDIGTGNPGSSIYNFANARKSPGGKPSVDFDVVKLVNTIITEGYKQGVSDIHIEPGMDSEVVLVRFRHDGILRHHMELPGELKSALVSRIKIMANLDISERRRPQDGKIVFRTFSELDMELRVATLPTSQGGEDVVLRIPGACRPLQIEELGVLDENRGRLEKVISSPYGLIVVCGPTGSGKTSTLHAILSRLNTPEVKILTAEDPVEITQKGLRQVQITPKVRNFAGILRAFLRCDPDIIMIGEMRDSETAGIAVEAALTGHLVLATLHTNSAPEAMTRLLDLGVDPFSFSDTLLCVLAQRLVRKLCPHCATEVTLSRDQAEHFLMEYCTDLLRTDWFKEAKGKYLQMVKQDLLKRFGRDGTFVMKQPIGCEYCHQTGYSGRVPLHELMIVSDDTKALIQENARAKILRSQALREGMLSLRMDGMAKVLLGLTDLTQVRTASMSN